MEWGGLPGLVPVIFETLEDFYNVSNEKDKVPVVLNLGESKVPVSLETFRQACKPYVNEVTLTGQNPPLKYC